MVARALLLALVLVVMVPAGAPAAGCANVTVSVYGGGKQTLRIKRTRGSVTCTRAAGLTRAYFKRVAAGRCGRLNNFCVLDMGRNWTCGIYSARRGKGAVSYCAEQRSGGAAFNHFVVLAPGVKEYPQFLSADRRVWCAVGDRARCTYAAEGSGPQHSAVIDAGGKVSLCSVPAVTFEQQCIQNFNDDAPVLKVGQRVELAGFVCTSEPDGITCKQTAGGKGFKVGPAGAVEL